MKKIKLFILALAGFTMFSCGTSVTSKNSGKEPVQDDSEEESQPGPDWKYIGKKAPGSYKIGDVVYTDGSSDKSSSTEAIKNNKDKAIAIIFRASSGSKKALGIGLDYTKTNWITQIPHKESPLPYHESAGYRLTADDMTNLKAICAEDIGEADENNYEWVGDVKAYNPIYQVIQGDESGKDNFQIFIDMLDKAGKNDTGLKASNGNNPIKPSDLHYNGDYAYPVFWYAYQYAEKRETKLLNTDYENDWYVPSAMEMKDFLVYFNNNKTVFQNLMITFTGSEFNTNYFYWTSTLADSNYIWFADLNNTYVSRTNNRNSASIYTTNGTRYYAVFAVHEF